MPTGKTASDRPVPLSTVPDQPVTLSPDNRKESLRTASGQPAPLSTVPDRPVTLSPDDRKETASDQPVSLSFHNQEKIMATRKEDKGHHRIQQQARPLTLAPDQLPVVLPYNRKKKS